MKKRYIPILFFFSLINNLSNAQQITRRTCGTMSHLEKQKAIDPELTSRMQAIESHTANYVATHRNSSSSAAIVTIPVVFHIVYNNTAQNISDARCLAQINQLNLDYAKLNTDFSTVPTAFQSAAADTKIQFCLAQRDPSGNSSTGIIRKSTTVASFIDDDKVKSAATGGDNPWDRTKYLNVWVCNLGNQLLGYATLPGGTASKDGVVLLYSTVGSMTTPGTASPYNLGRTATHEVGHWLNMLHIWGDDGGACSGSDLVGDTPNQAGENYQCPSFPLTDNCTTTSPGVMFMNYMDYVDDNCMKMFTNGQATRMQALFATGGARASLITSTGCQPVAAGAFSFNSIAPVSITCGTNSASGSLSSTSTGGFTTPINLTSSGNPAGTTVSFSVNPVTPGNTTTVTLNNTASLQPGTYNITVTGTAGTATQTATVSFTVVQGAPPAITTQPSSTGVCNGATATFSSATSTAGASYQWQQSTDGGTTWTNISGATNAGYTTPASTVTMNNYKYKVVMTSQCATTTSNAATLTVNPVLSITAQPADATVGTGTNVSFNTTVTGASVTYQWQDSSSSNNWQNIAGATGSTYTITNTTLGMSGTKYRVTLNSTCGNATSNAALLTVVAGSFSLSNNSISVPCGTDSAKVTLNSSTVGTFTTPINLTALNLPTGTTYSITTNPLTPGNTTTISLNNSDSLVPGAYAYTVTGTANAIVQSTTVNVTITDANPTPIRSEEQPSDATGVIGGNVNFTTTYTKNVRSFQWQMSTDETNWTDITGATNATYTKSSIEFADNSTYYRVRMITNCGMLYSKSALLSIPMTIHPNPNNGNFSIAVNLPDQNKIMRKVSAVLIFNSNGSKVFEKKITGSVTQKIDCNVATLSTGIYQVIILDDAGSIIQQAPVLINNLK